MEPSPDSTETDAEPQGLQRVPWGIAEAVLVLVAFYVAAPLLWLTVQQALLDAEVVDSLLLDRLSLPVVFLVMGLPPVVWLTVRHHDAIRRLFGSLRPSARSLAVGLGLGAVVIIGIRLLLSLFLFIGAGGVMPDLPDLQPEYQELATDPALSAWFLVTVVVFAPLAEEVLFRGILFQALRDRLGLWPGIGWSSVVFTVLHLNAGQPLEANLLVFVLIFPLSMFLAWIFERRGSLLVPIVVHAAHNAIGVTLFRLAG